MGKLIRNGIEYGGGNGTDIYEVTQSEYDALKQAGTLVRDALYIISDAPNLNETADDIEYSSGVSVKDAIDSKANTSDLATVATSGSYTDLSDKPDAKSFMRCAYWTSESKTTYVLNYDYMAGISKRPYGMAIVSAWKDIFALHYNSDTSIFIVKMTNSSDRTATCAWDSTNRTITLTFSGTIWSGIAIYPM